ncbi:MAG: ferritin-like domain-containing protein [Candidatus Sericytochromatia bacterium]
MNGHTPTLTAESLPPLCTPSLTQQVRQSLHKTELHSTREVEQILNRRREVVAPAADFASLWSLQALGLGGVSCVQAASEEVQQALRAQLGRGRLSEAWQIEKAGLSFAAKMSLLAESSAEQQLYALFGAEEAQHFALIQQALGPLTPAPDPFITLLHAMIAEGSRSSLQLMIQVVLEGWGIEHYANMMKQCQHAPLKAGLQQILSDEGAHHGSGVSLFKAAQVSQADLAQMVEFMTPFLYMVQIGPVSALQAVHEQLGGLTRAQEARVLDEMDAVADTTRKLQLLRQLMLKAEGHALVERLDGLKAFQALI